MALIYRRLVSVPKLMYCSIKTNSLKNSMKAKNLEISEQKKLKREGNIHQANCSQHNCIFRTPANMRLL